MHYSLLILIGMLMGSVCRIKLSGLLLAHSLTWKFPWVSFMLNLIVFLIIGFLVGHLIKMTQISKHSPLLLLSGLVGGFAVLSVFSLEAIMLFHQGSIVLILAYIVLNILIGLSMLGFGFTVSQFTK